MQGLICIGGECQTGLLGLRLNLRLGLLAAALGLGLFLSLGRFLRRFLHVPGLRLRSRGGLRVSGVSSVSVKLVAGRVTSS